MCSDRLVSKTATLKPMSFWNKGQFNAIFFYGQNFFPSDLEPNSPQIPVIDKAPIGNTRITSLDVLCFFDLFSKNWWKLVLHSFAKKSSCDKGQHHWHELRWTTCLHLLCFTKVKQNYPGYEHTEKNWVYAVVANRQWRCSNKFKPIHLTTQSQAGLSSITTFLPIFIASNN